MKEVLFRKSKVANGADIMALVPEDKKEREQLETFLHNEGVMNRMSRTLSKGMQTISVKLNILSKLQWDGEGKTQCSATCDDDTHVPISFWVVSWEQEPEETDVAKGSKQWQVWYSFDHTRETARPWR